MAFSPPEYCRLFAQKKAYQGGVTGTPGPRSLATPLYGEINRLFYSCGLVSEPLCEHEAEVDLVLIQTSFVSHRNYTY